MKKKKEKRKNLMEMYKLKYEIKIILNNIKINLH